MKPLGTVLVWVALSLVAAAQSAVFFSKDPSAPEDKGRLRQQLAALIQSATGQSTPEAGWRSLVNTKDRVGIKIAGGPGLMPTHTALVEAVVAGLQSAGVERSNISIWAKARRFDSKATFTAPVSGSLIWGDLLFEKRQGEQISETSHFGVELLAVDKIINLSVLCGAEDLGIVGALYNVTIPNIDNWRRFLQRGADVYLCELFADERIRPKVAIHIMDGLSAQYAGGPKFEPNYAFAHGTLYASKDPVALDALALQLVQKWRVQARLPLPKNGGACLDTAEAMGLGKKQFQLVEAKAP